MENEFKSIEDIKAIRKIMEESSRFLSLSGLSGVFAGITAIAGALVAYFLILKNGDITYDAFAGNVSAYANSSVGLQLITVALIVLVVSVLSAYYFSIRKAKRDQKSFWTPVSKRLLIHLLIPLVTGAVFVMLLINKGYIQLIIPSFLIFYGLALVNAGKWTFSEIFYLGIFEIFTGLIAAGVNGGGLLFWIFGFGILHIFYGVAMFRKYEV